MIAKIGDLIEWSFDDSKNYIDFFKGKTFQAEVAMIDSKEQNYGVYASYGMDYISFDKAKIVKVGKK